MVKGLFSTPSSYRVFFFALVTLFFFGKRVDAQCGLSAFPGPGNPYTPTSTFQPTDPMGSNTYAEFNVLQDKIYSFYFTSTTAPVTNNDWDMTVSSTSTPIGYNNSTSPLPNSWWGGLGACASTTQPASAEWYSTYSGAMRINVKSYSGVCDGFVANEGSAIINYKVCNPSPDPGIGHNVWNVDAYVTTNLAIPNPGARYGSYVDPNLNFVTSNFWANYSNPSALTGATWTGCEMPNSNFVVRGRRVGFPCGVYSIVVNKAFHVIEIFLNGTQIYTGTDITTGTTVGTYALGPNDNLEVRFNDICYNVNSGGVANISITQVTTAAVNGGTIGGVANNSNVCQGSVLGNFTNVTSASGGTTASNNGGAITYDWLLSTNGGTTFAGVSGVTTSSWNSLLSVPPDSVYVVVRRATDECGNQALSNSITVTGRPAPNGSFSPLTQTICPGATTSLTLHFNPGTGPFSFGYNDGLQSFSRTGEQSGDTILVTPHSASTTYSFTTITDSYGCTTTSGFTGGALVTTANPISISGVNVTPALCYGTSTGIITVNASGGLGTLTYSDNGGTSYQASNQFDSLAAGNYVVAVQDSFGCVQNARSTSFRWSGNGLK